MQARLETNRFPAAAVAVMFAVVALFMLSVGGGYAIKSLSESGQAVVKAPLVRPVVQDGPQSDLTRVLPVAADLKALGGPQSDLTRALPQPPMVEGGPQSDLTRARPGHRPAADSTFDTCPARVDTVC